MENNINQKPHSFTLENRNKITLTGISDVGSFDEENLKIFTQYGEIDIKGENLQVTALNLEAGELVAEGKFNSLMYTDKILKGSGFFSKVFK